MPTPKSERAARRDDYLIESRADGPVRHQRACSFVTSVSLACSCGGVDRWIRVETSDADAEANYLAWWNEQLDNPFVQALCTAIQGGLERDMAAVLIGDV